MTELRPDATREVFRGKRIGVVVERWDDRDREIVRHPGAVAVVATTAEGHAVLVRQLREAVREVLLEVPAGTLDVPGESPEEAGRRELLEETGYGGGSWSSLGSIYSSPGFTNELIHLLRAEGVEPRGESEEGIDVELLPLAEARGAVDDGRIVDAKSVAALVAATSAGRGNLP